MSVVRVKKIVAACFLEAAKLSLEHLGAHRLELDGRRAPGAGEVARHYGACRRLRDYLQTCTRSAANEIELDFESEDQALLVACCRRLVESIDQRVVLMPDGKARSFEEKKREVISDWAVELAAYPLLDFSMQPLGNAPGSKSSDLKRRIQQKLFSGSEQSLIRSGSITSANVISSRLAAGPSETAVAVDKVQEMTDVMQASAEPERLLDSSMVNEPRLRTMVAMDIRSLKLAEENADYRVATVMLASILESAILDYAIPRGAQFKTVGTPDTWSPQEIMLHVLGEDATSADREFIFSLFLSRNMLKPAHQIISPTLATAASVQRTHEFVAAMLAQLGYRAATARPLEM